MTQQVRKIGGWWLLVGACLAAFVIAAPSEDGCSVSTKPNFTSALTQSPVSQRGVLQHVTLQSIGYGDHPTEAPAFEQVTFTFATRGEDDGRVPCVRVDEVAAGLRVTIGANRESVDIGKTFNSRLQHTLEKLPAGSIYESIEQTDGSGGVSFLIRLRRFAPYCFSSSVSSGTGLFFLKTRSFRSTWITMDPAVLKSVFGPKTVIGHIEYRLPSDASDRTALDVAVRVRENSGLERPEMTVTVLNAPIRLENLIAEKVQQSEPGAAQPTLEQPSPAIPRADAQSPILLFALNGLQSQAEAIRHRTGASAAYAFVFNRLEEFAKLTPSAKYRAGYHAIEQSYSAANVSGDERFLYRLFANFASARLAALKDTSLPPELPRAGKWTLAEWNGQARSLPPPQVEPVFDEPFWSWHQGIAAVSYNVGICRAALHDRSEKGFDSESLNRLYGGRLVVEVAGSYTTADGSIAALAARDGVIVGFLPRPWEGLVVIRDGTARVVSVLELTSGMVGGARPTALRIFSSPDDFIEFLDLVRKNKISLIQGHLLTLHGKYDASANDTVRARRRVLITAAGSDASSVEVVDFSESREMTLRQCAKWLGGFDKDGTSINLDTGAWDFGRFYSPDGKVRNLGAQASSDERLSNKFVFSRKVRQTQ